MNFVDSLLIGIHGPRGGGKTCLLSYFGAWALKVGKSVWANYKISFDQNGDHYESMPLDMNKLYTYSPEFQNGLVLFDEMQYMADAMRSASNANKLLDGFVMQLRKRQLDLVYTAKVFEWIDKRIRYETDVQIFCRDACHSPWGQETNLKKGEVFNLLFRDLSGVITGFSYYENPQSFPLDFNGKITHNLFDTNEIIDVLESMRGVENRMGKRIISDDVAPDESLIETLRDMFQVGEKVTAAKTWAELGITKQTEKTMVKQTMANIGIYEKIDKGIKVFSLSP